MALLPSRSSIAPTLLAGSLVFLAGCADTGSAPPGALVTGAPTAAVDVFGTRFEPCTGLELEGFPTALAKPSADYYEGPWCSRKDADRAYLWAWARPLSTQQTGQSAYEAVVVDAQTAILDLIAQGYYRVCGAAPSAGPVDAGFEKPGEASRLRLQTAGTVAVSGSGTPTESADPLSVTLRLSPATRGPGFADNETAPPC